MRAHTENIIFKVFGTHCGDKSDLGTLTLRTKVPIGIVGMVVVAADTTTSFFTEKLLLSLMIPVIAGNAVVVIGVGCEIPKVVTSQVETVFPKQLVTFSSTKSSVGQAISAFTQQQGKVGVVSVVLFSGSGDINLRVEELIEGQTYFGFHTLSLNEKKKNDLKLSQIEFGSFAKFLGMEKVLQL
jgi:hypothetical protein